MNPQGPYKQYGPWGPLVPQVLLSLANLKIQRTPVGVTIRLDEIQDWLMEPDERPTTWPTLVRIRREKPHCRRRAE